MRLVQSLVLLLVAAACSKEPDRDAARAIGAGAARIPSANPVEITVYAATSTRDVLLALAEPYERDHDVNLVFNFGSSGDLSKQIVAAAKADVFLSADEKEMDNVEAAGLVAAGSRRALLSNLLVVIEPADGATIFASPFDAAQLAGAKVERLSLGHVETVPAGRYAKAWLAKAGVWEKVQARVLPGVDVRAALAAVESGGAQAGVVYATDAAQSNRARVVFRVPAADGPKISYPVAAIAGRPGEERASAFVEFLGSAPARAAFEAHGFVHLPAPASSAK